MIVLRPTGPLVPGVERIAVLRRKDPVLDAAIDALDLDLAD